jgi:hypothetical protein
MRQADLRIADEQRRAETRKALRELEYDDGDDSKDEDHEGGDGGEAGDDNGNDGP